LCDWPTTTWDCRAGLQPPGLPSVATNSTPGLVRAVRLASIDERLSAGVATIGKSRVRDARGPPGACRPETAEFERVRPRNTCASAHPVSRDVFPCQKYRPCLRGILFFAPRSRIVPPQPPPPAITR
jgi:hypothetical protein